MDRRQFLKRAAGAGSALTLGNAIRPAGAAEPALADPRHRYTLPEHLPEKLSIGMFIWNWVTMATPGEPYDNLQKVVAGLPERGFNAVRVEAGLNWCFRIDGRPRGEMEFGTWIPGYSDNLTSVHAKGGGRHDVLKRVVHLMELARKHDVHVILTSWEYQDSSWFVADPKIRAEVMGVPAVCDEGGYFYPPRGSKFELTLPGTSMFELQVDLAIKHGYWGMMPTTYCGPEQPIWENVAWCQAINGRFRAGKMSAAG